MNTKKFSVEGMHCASCALVISKKIKKVPGVKDVDVSFATNTAKITFSDELVPIYSLNEDIEKLGYTLIDEQNTHHDHEISVAQPSISIVDEERNKMLFVLPISLLVFVIMLWDIIARNSVVVPKLPLPMELFDMILLGVSTIVLFWVGAPFVRGVWNMVRYGAINMDTLIGVGTLTAYLYSVLILLFPQIMLFLRLPNYTYFDVTIVVIGFVIFGKYLESRSRQKTGEAIKKLINLQAKTARVIRDAKEVEIPISDVLVGDMCVVRPGETISVDGKVVKGTSSINESMITGESIPVDKTEGDVVIGGTINMYGAFTYEATKVGSDTMLARIIQLVEDAQSSKAPIQKLADTVSSVFVPVVIGVALLSLILWVGIGTWFIGSAAAWSYGILSLVGVLVIACPCALGLATPTAIIVGVGKGAQHGILVKNAESLERLSRVTTVVCDKTGTLTNGTPIVISIHTYDYDYTEETLMYYAGSVEHMSEHPLAHAVISYLQEHNITIGVVSDFVAIQGVGVRGLVDKKRVYIRKAVDADTDEFITKAYDEGASVMIVEIDGVKKGFIALSDTAKDSASDAIETLRQKNIKVVMLTGDNIHAASAIGKKVGIHTVEAHMLPEDKVEYIKKLHAQGEIVAMVGDGVNDAPALAQANIGIAMATGTDVAIESAGITLLHGDISKLVKAINLSKITMRGIKQNLFWAFIYNIIGIPVAAGLLYPIWGIMLNPVFAGLAMAFSSVSVVGNSLRLKTKKL